MRALLATGLVALVCVAAAVGSGQKITLRIDGVSHTYSPSGGNYLCVQVSGTVGASLLVEVFGPGVAEGHTFSQSMLGPRGKVLVGFPLRLDGRHRVKVTANKPRQGRSVATKDYTVPTPDVAPLGRFSCI